MLTRDQIRLRLERSRGDIDLLIDLLSEVLPDLLPKDDLWHDISASQSSPDQAHIYHPLTCSACRPGQPCERMRAFTGEQ